jgi:hypothetical protein
MKTSEMKATKKTYKGRPRGYYDPSPVEEFFTKVGQAIYKFTDDNQHKTMMTDEDWIAHCNAANKCVRFGTLYGPKELSDFKQEELIVVREFVGKKVKWI